MNNPNDVYTLRQAETLLEKNKHPDSSPSSKEPTLTFSNLPEEHCSDDLFSYSIFHNPASHYHTGDEYLRLNHDDASRARWLAYYPPDYQALPQKKNLQCLFQQSDELNQEAASLKAPRLAISTLCLLVGVFLLFSGSAQIALIPLVIMLAVWLYSSPSLYRHQKRIIANSRLVKAQHHLFKNLQNEGSHLPVAATDSEMHDTFAQTLHDFIVSSVQHYSPGLSEERLIQNLYKKKTKIFLLASSALLQTTSLCHQEPAIHPSLEKRLKEYGDGLCALPKHDGQHTRLLYLYTVICSENGVLLCTAFYDRVTDSLHGQQHFYYQNNDLLHINTTDTRLTDEDSCLKGYLSHELCEHYRQKALKVVSLHTSNGEKHCCVLQRQRVATKLFTTTGHGARLTRYIQRDVDKLTAGLTARI